MSLSANAKKTIIEKFRTSDSDTASPQVQIAILTERLQYLNKHFQANKKDNHSKTGLMKMVGKRRRLLDYLKRTKPTDYQTLITELNIRK